MQVKHKLGVVAVAGLLVTGIVFAQAQRMHGGGFMEHRMQFIANHLDLTDAQKSAAKTLHEETRAQAQPIVDKLKAGHEAMAAAVKANKPDAEIDQLAAQQGTLMGQLAAVHAKALAKFYSQLTPEQKAKADQLHENMKGMMANHFGHH